MNNWGHYLNFAVDEMKIKAQSAGLIGHGGKIGENREMILGEFLDRHLPKRLSKCNGKIFDVEDNISKEIDIIIYNDISINFSQVVKMTINIESVASAISVKSKLDKKQLYDSLKNLASIPQIEGNVLGFKLLSNKHENQNLLDFFKEDYPKCYVFAYDGLNPKITVILEDLHWLRC